MRPDEPRSVGRRLHPFVSLLSWHELAVVSLPSFPCLLVLKQDEQLLFGGLLQSLRLYFQRMWTRASRPETRASESPCSTICSFRSIRSHCSFDTATFRACHLRQAIPVELPSWESDGDSDVPGRPCAKLCKAPCKVVSSKRWIFWISRGSRGFKGFKFQPGTLGIYRLLMDTDGLSAVEELEAMQKHEKCVSSRKETVEHFTSLYITLHHFTSLYTLFLGAGSLAPW